MAGETEETGAGTETDKGKGEETDKGGANKGGELGQAGTDAIAAERRKASEEKAARRAAENKLKEAEAELARITEGSKTEVERAVAEARREEREATLKAATDRVIGAEVRALATGKLAHPEDAVALLGGLDELRSKILDADGNVEAKRIESAIADLLKERPGYAATASRNGAGEGGARGGSTTGGPTMDDWIRGSAGRPT